MKRKVFIIFGVFLLLSVSMSTIAMKRFYEHGYDNGYVEGYSIGFEQGNTARSAFIFTFHTSENITIKYLKDPGWIVKWHSGEAVKSDNTTLPITSVQRFGAWLQNETGREFNIQWDYSELLAK